MASEEIRNSNIEILNKSQTQNSNVQNFLHAGFTRILHERIYFAGSDSTVMTQCLDKNLLNFGFWSFGLVSDLVLRISNFLHGIGRHSHSTQNRPRGPGFQIPNKDHTSGPDSITATCSFCTKRRRHSARIELTPSRDQGSLGWVIVISSPVRASVRKAFKCPFSSSVRPSGLSTLFPSPPPRSKKSMTSSKVSKVPLCI